jgi:hypothetical protein
MGKKRSPYNVTVIKLEGKRLLKRPRHRRTVTIEMDLEEIW